MAEKKTTKKATDAKETAAKKSTTTTTRATSKKAVESKVAVAINAENIGFKAGDVYQALAAAERALNVEEIAAAAKISTEETLLGLGWLFKEGKLLSAEDNKVVLA